MNRNIAIIILVFFFLIACNRPQEKIIPIDTSKWDAELKPVIEKLTDEEKALLAGFLARTKLREALGGQKMAENLTVGKAIEEQRKFLQEQKKKEAEAQALKEKLERERVALRKQVDDILVVTVLGKKIIKGSFESGNFMDRQIIKIGFQNKGIKDIRGIKGEVKFIDIFDKEVGGISFSYDDGVKAGKTATWTGARDYNQFIANHRALANLEEGKYKIRFEPEMIIFSDGARIEIKE